MQESSVYRSIKAEGKIEGEVEERRKIATNALREGFAPDVVARLTGLSIEEIQQLQQEMIQSSQS